MQEQALIESWYHTTNPREEVHHGSVFGAWGLRVLEREMWQSVSPRAKSLYYCAYGLLAPTTHNSVPQKFKVDANGAIQVFLDRKWILPASDPEGRQAVISIGAVIETLLQAATAYGDRFDVDLDDVEPSALQACSESDRNKLTDGVDLIRLATLTPANATETPREVEIQVLDLLKSRKTMRAEFDRSGLDPALISWIDAHNDQNNNALPRLHAITNTALINQFAKQFHKRAIQAAVSDPRFQYELGEWLLPNDETTSERRMRGREFGRGDLATIKLRDGMLGKRDQLANEIEGFAHAEMMNMASASAIFVITTADQSPHQWIQAGRLYQRFALLLAQYGYYHSMQAALSEISFMEIEVANVAVKTTVLKTPDRHIQVIFRAGRLRHADDAERPHSSRPDLRALLL